MRKISSYLVALFAFASMTFLTTGCGEDAEDPATPLPAADGLVTINLLNYPNSSPQVTAAVGDVIAVAVEMTKGANGRPQKLRVWEAASADVRGTQVGSTIDLRNVDTQVKNVNYTVSSIGSKIYLYFEVDESGGKFSRKTLIINVTGTGSYSEWTSKTLGAQTNALASRIASSTGYVYTACEVQANVESIDITYAYLAGGATLLSNPFRGDASTGLTSSTATCDDGSRTTTGGPTTYFVATTASYADTDTDEEFNALAVSSSNSQSVVVQAGKTYAFTSNGKKGLIRVNNVSGTTAGTITLDVKVQR